jgi:arylsulfatase A-like enzyme
MRAFFSFFACTVIISALAIAADAPSRVKPSRPNIVFILCDDLAQGDLGCYGQKLIQTPNLDRMAAEGTRFTSAYSGTSVCAPSRSSLMTGLHTGHCPVRGNREQKPEGQLPLPEGTATVAQLLKAQGYATACVGKWGMGMFDSTGSPFKKGFDHFYGYNCQRHAHSYFPTYLYNDDKRIELPENEKAQKTYAQDLLEQDALKWVKSHKASPFFLYYALTLPHGKYEIDTVGIYKDRDWTLQQKTYAAMVTRLDRAVGELLDLLKSEGIDQNTVMFFAGDNGSSFAPTSEIGKFFDQSMNGKLRGFKRGMYEGGLRQAALARWPGHIPAGRVTDEPWAFWDFLPTAVELAGGKLPSGTPTDGLSLVKFLEGGKAPPREYFYWELHEGQQPKQAVRFGDWKAVRNNVGGAWELYNLSNDLAEATDVAAQHPKEAAKAESYAKAARTADANWPLEAKQPAKKNKN